jgi:hypothetical protein
MVVYVVNVTRVDDGMDFDFLGAYSNLALAGRAVNQYIDQITIDDNIPVRMSYRSEEPWGYSFMLTDSIGEVATVEIIRTTLNE